MGGSVYYSRISQFQLNTLRNMTTREEMVDYIDRIDPILTIGFTSTSWLRVNGIMSCLNFNNQGNYYLSCILEGSKNVNHIDYYYSPLKYIDADDIRVCWVILNGLKTSQVRESLNTEIDRYDLSVIKDLAKFFNCSYRNKDEVIIVHHYD